MGGVCVSSCVWLCIFGVGLVVCASGSILRLHGSLVLLGESANG
jgi:hypothetical protein